ncbi:hypothetical protein SAMN04490207_1616 [Pseudomonas gessardii]|nr:hypothetical protein SAMN04490207_1616 [Pseudomonas gessardii]
MSEHYSSNGEPQVSALRVCRYVSKLVGAVLLIEVYRDLLSNCRYSSQRAENANDCVN